jgi:succinate-semialdehyde dehydrogenase/glutarate-semialdehyde dehydrogenase
MAAFNYRSVRQVCIAPPCFYVQDACKPVLARFAEYASGTKRGNGLEKSTMGPLANVRRLGAMDAFVSDTRERGAKTGGRWKGNQGNFSEPTAITDPLELGLAVYAFTSLNATATTIGDTVESEVVGINSVAISTPETPLGGVKASGHGSEGGIERFDACLNVKSISQSQVGASGNQ